MSASLGADFAMLVHLRMAGAFCRTATAERDAGGQLRFEELTMANLVRARHDACRGRAHCGAVLVKPDAADESLDTLFRETGIRASVAGFDGRRTGIDTHPDGVDMTRLFRMGTEHRADGDCGHADFLRVICWSHKTHFG